MNKIWLVFKREYLTRVKKKTFIIVTLLVPLSIVCLMGIQVGFMFMNQKKSRILVKDDSQVIGKPLDNSNLFFKLSEEPLYSLKENYAAKGFDGVLYIPKVNIKNPSGIKYFSEELLGLSTKSYIEREIRDDVRKIRLEDLGVNSKDVADARNVSINVIEEKGGEGSILSSGIATGAGMFMGFLMYMTIFIYGSMVMRSVMEEKSNRIVEVILSSVQPFKLMMGKILGVGAVGLTQFAIWIVLLGTINIGTGLFIGNFVDMPDPASQIEMSGAAADFDQSEILEMYEEVQASLDSLNMPLLVFGFLFFFVTGYILYAALFAGLASAINDESDAQLLTLPVGIPVIIAFFILFSIVEAPNSTFAIWTSLVPLFAPILMPARIAFGIPFWQILLGMVLMIVGSIFAVWIAAKIYRTGILMYGKKVSFKEIGKWLLR